MLIESSHSFSQKRWGQFIRSSDTIPVYESQRNHETLRIAQLDLRQAGDLVRLVQERVVAHGVDLVQEPAIPTALERPTRDGKELFPLWIQAGRTGILCAQFTRIIGPVALTGRLTSGGLDDGARHRLLPGRLPGRT